MAVLQRLLVALDCSAAASAARDLAIDCARAFGGELIFLAVVDRGLAIAEMSAPSGASYDLVAVLETDARTVLDEATSRARAANVRSSTLLMDGRPGPPIVACARLEHADGIVMGTAGMRGLERAFFGSTAASVLRATCQPTMVVHGPDDPVRVVLTSFARIFVACDDSEPADAACDFAIDLAAQSGASLVFGTVLETGDLIDTSAMYGYDSEPLARDLRTAAIARLETLTRAAMARGVTACRAIVENTVVRATSENDDTSLAVIAAANEHGANLIVIGSHGRRGIRRLLLGSVAERVVSRGTLPTVVIRSAVSSSTVSQNSSTFGGDDLAVETTSMAANHL